MRRVVLAAAAVILVGAIAYALADGDGSDGRSLAVRAASTTTSSSSTTVVETTTTTTTTTTTAAPAPVTTTRPPTSRPRPATTAPAPATCSTPGAGSDFDGFGAAAIVIRNADGSHRSCVLTADTPDQQQRGLMHQDDLDGYAGMIFRFSTEEPRTFWMRNTRIPLSIAFFAADGTFVSATDMEPCGDSEDCPRYTSNGRARFALEVPRGGLAQRGATAGSRLVV